MYVQEINAIFPISIADSILTKSLEVRDDDLNWYIQDRIELDPSEVTAINDWLATLGLPALEYIIIFQRKNSVGLKNENNSNIYMDYNEFLNEPVNASVNIPIANCFGTSELWWTGNYRSTKRYSDMRGNRGDVKNTEQRIPFREITWTGAPELAYNFEVQDKPFLVNTGIPHSMTAPSSEYRVMLSIRLDGNPTFEEVEALLVANDVAMGSDPIR